MSMCAEEVFITALFVLQNIGNYLFLKFYSKLFLSTLWFSHYFWYDFVFFFLLVLFEFNQLPFCFFLIPFILFLLFVFLIQDFYSYLQMVVRKKAFSFSIQWKPDGSFCIANDYLVFLMSWWEKVVGEGRSLKSHICVHVRYSG